MNSKPYKQQGFSLTELMVAMVIGLVVLAGVSSVMVSNKKTYTAQDSLSRLQENARAAMLIMTRDLRNVGYWGCNPEPENVTNLLNGAASNFYFNNGESLEGSEAAGNFFPSNTAMALTPTPRANTDVIMIRGLDTASPVGITDPMPSASQNIKIADNSGLVTGEIVALTDCNSTDIFQITGIQDAGGGKDMLQHRSGTADNPGNRSLGGPDKISKPYGADATIMRYMAHSYFIAPGASGEPSLYRQTVVAGTPTSQELVEGIENLQVLYGLDTNNDKIADDYKKASLVGAASWNNVVSVRFGIVARALANLDTRNARTAATASQLDTKPLDVDGDGVNDFTGAETGTTTVGGETVMDRQYQRRMFRTTVLLRNKQIGM